MKQAYLDTRDSTIFYKIGNIKLFFSTVNKREMYIKRYKSFIESEKFKFRNKYSIELNESFDALFVFILYQKIESRGYKYQIVSETGHILKECVEIPEFILTF